MPKSIGNRHFKLWLKNLDPQERVKKMGAIAKYQSSNGLKGSVIKASFAQLSQRCEVQLVPLTNEEIRFYTRKKVTVLHHLNETVCIPKALPLYLQEVAGSSDSKLETNTKDESKNKKLKRKFKELFGDDCIHPKSGESFLEKDHSAVSYVSQTLNVNVNVNVNTTSRDELLRKGVSKHTKTKDSTKFPTKKLRIDLSLPDNKQYSSNITLLNKPTRAEHRKKGKKQKDKKRNKSNVKTCNFPEEDSTIKELWSILGMEDPTARSETIIKSYPNLPVNTNVSNTITQDINNEITSESITQIGEGPKEDGAFCKISQTFSLAEQHESFNSTNKKSSPLEENSHLVLDISSEDSTSNASSNPGLSNGNKDGESKIGKIRVKNMVSLINPNANTGEVPANSIRSTSSASNDNTLVCNQSGSSPVGKDNPNNMFFLTYKFYFNESVESKIPKLGELLHLAITDEIRCKDCIARASLLSSVDLVAEEKLRAEKDFHEKMKLRGTDFVPLFLEIFNSFEEKSQVVLFFAFFYRILKDSSRISSGHIKCLSEAKNVVRTMLQSLKSNVGTLLNILEADLTAFAQQMTIISKLVEEYHNQMCNQVTSVQTKFVGGEIDGNLDQQDIHPNNKQVQNNSGNLTNTVVSNINQNQRIPEISQNSVKTNRTNKLSVSVLAKAQMNLKRNQQTPATIHYMPKSSRSIIQNIPDNQQNASQANMNKNGAIPANNLKTSLANNNISPSILDSAQNMAQENLNRNQQIPVPARNVDQTKQTDIQQNIPDTHQPSSRPIISHSQTSENTRNVTLLNDNNCLGNYVAQPFIRSNRPAMSNFTNTAQSSSSQQIPVNVQNTAPPNFNSNQHMLARVQIPAQSINSSNNQSNLPPDVQKLSASNVQVNHISKQISQPNIRYVAPMTQLQNMTRKQLVDPATIVNTNKNFGSAYNRPAQRISYPSTSIVIQNNKANSQIPRAQTITHNGTNVQIQHNKNSPEINKLLQGKQDQLLEVRAIRSNSSSETVHERSRFGIVESSVKRSLSSPGNSSQGDIRQNITLRSLLESTSNSNNQALSAPVRPSAPYVGERSNVVNDTGSHKVVSPSTSENITSSQVFNPRQNISSHAMLNNVSNQNFNQMLPTTVHRNKTSDHTQNSFSVNNYGSLLRQCLDVTETIPNSEVNSHTAQDSGRGIDESPIVNVNATSDLNQSLPAPPIHQNRERQSLDQISTTDHTQRHLLPSHNSQIQIVPSSSHCHPFIRTMPISGKMKMFFGSK